MNVMTKTDKMLSRKEGGVGYLTFNNPERHNAVSLEMWEAAAGILEEFKNDKNIRVVVLYRRRRQSLRVGRRYFEIRKRAFQQGRDRPLQRGGR